MGYSAISFIEVIISFIQVITEVIGREMDTLN